MKQRGGLAGTGAVGDHRSGVDTADLKVVVEVEKETKDACSKGGGEAQPPAKKSITVPRKPMLQTTLDSCKLSSTTRPRVVSNVVIVDVVESYQVDVRDYARWSGKI